MASREKILDRVLRGTSDANVSFDELCGLLQWLGFRLRIRGSHHIFTKDNMVDIINLQSKGGTAKPYQVKQVRNLILKYKLGGEPHDQV